MVTKSLCDRLASPWHAAAGVALLAALAVSAPAHAQLGVTAYTVGAVDGNDTDIELVGVSVQPEGLGLKPTASLQAYRLGYAIGPDAGATVYSLTPAVGVEYRLRGGSVEGKVGYAFQEGDVDNDVLFFDAGESGVKTSFQAIYWGGEPELQALASYGWASNSLYSQAQGTVGVWNLNPGEIGVGAEAVWQGDLGNADDYRSQSFGPVLRWVSGNALITSLSGGWTDSNRNDATYYLKLVLVYAP